MPGLHGQVRDACVIVGIPLEFGVAVPWLTGRGHLCEVVQDGASPEAISALTAIHAHLGGDAALLAAKRRGTPIPDLIHAELGCIIEIDEEQHFTSARRESFAFYPSACRLGYDLSEYQALVEKWSPRGDRAYAHKVSADFPQPGGRQAQRAYNDALRDLLAMTFTGYPAIRIPVPDRSLDGVSERVRVAIAALDAPNFTR